MFALHTANYEPKANMNIYEIALQELKKRDREKYRYARSFMSAISYLALKGYYDLELVNLVLSTEYWNKAFSELSFYFPF